MLLLVRGRSGDELSKCRKEVVGGSDGLVLSVDGRERPVGPVQAVRAGDSVPPGCENVKLKEQVVVWCAAHYVRLLAVGSGCDAHVGGMYTTPLLLRGAMGVRFQSKVP